MYLHLGNDAVVNKSDIIGVFDMDNTTVSVRSRRFLTLAEKSGNVISTTFDLPKSYIVTAGRGGKKVYVSAISSNTLLKRANSSIITIME